VTRFAARPPASACAAWESAAAVAGRFAEEPQPKREAGVDANRFEQGPPEADTVSSRRAASLSVVFVTPHRVARRSHLRTARG
jgi:hypothetical protein